MRAANKQLPSADTVAIGLPLEKQTADHRSEKAPFVPIGKRNAILPRLQRRRRGGKWSFSSRSRIDRLDLKPPVCLSCRLEVRITGHLSGSRGDSLQCRVSVTTQEAALQFPNESFPFLDFRFGIEVS